MRYTTFFLVSCFLFSCNSEKKNTPFTTIEIQTLYKDTLSIRALELMGNSLAFAADKGTYGTVDLLDGKVRVNTEKYHTSIPEFRSVAHNATDFFMLSAGNPALLYKTGDHGKMDLVYKEEGEGVFYDALTFWNDQEGIAVGDSRDGCLSMIITRDGGNHWEKLPCEALPDAIEGEGAFAASNTNIKVLGNKTWIATTGSRIYFSSDKGRTWEIQEAPMVNEAPTQGIYSIDFYDENTGIAIGGDYTNPTDNRANKAVTKDGGITWKLVADGKEPDYKSCVRFIPNHNGKGLVALGLTGISYSNDSGETWKKLSDESFYTLRFQNDSVAYAAGKNRISRLTFR